MMEGATFEGSASALLSVLVVIEPSFNLLELVRRKFRKFEGGSGELNREPAADVAMLE